MKLECVCVCVYKHICFILLLLLLQLLLKGSNRTSGVICRELLLIYDTNPHEAQISSKPVQDEHQQQGKHGQSFVVETH